MEGIFLEINLRATKWLIFGGYNNNKVNIDNFLATMGPHLDYYLPKFDNLLLLGDFNSEPHETAMKEFCDIYNLQNLIKDPTCYKNALNPSLIDLILTNKPNKFQNSQVIETGLSDHHKLTISVLKLYFQKKSPLCIKYRDYKNFDHNSFQTDLCKKNYYMNNTKMDYTIFESVFMDQLNKHAPMKEKLVRANNAPFMTKKLSKAIMTRSRLRNRFLKNPNNVTKNNYNKQRNFCVNLLRKEKRQYYSNLDLKMITDNRKFWKCIKPLFSDKCNTYKKITLIDEGIIISKNSMVAETMNEHFSNAVPKLEIQGFKCEPFKKDPDRILNSINKFKNHPSILMIKQKVNVTEKFTFSPTSIADIFKIISNLDTNKPTTFNNIPVKVVVDTIDICAPLISNIYNDAIETRKFPGSLKLADITPVHKKHETTSKENYRPVSILPSISKIFERNMFDQISFYMDKHISKYLCGFRKGYSTQHCLIIMLEKWKKALDNRKLAGALLTDLSKAFDCLNHELMIAKLEAYGFDQVSLEFIYSYLSDRKHRTKINNYFSTWADIISGIPQGSILGPLLFNIYLNDIFLFVDETNLTNYADDNTPYAIDLNIDQLMNRLTHDASILIRWFKDNYFKMNADKCQLLITNHVEDVSAVMDGENINCKKSVKLLGITIDNKLDFTEHVSNLCKMVSQKLHALARISNYFDINKLRIIMKSFIESQFAYCPLIWMFHSRTLNNRINRLHERALRLVYKDSQLSFEELLEQDNSFTIHHRNLQKLATEIFKVKKDISPTFMKNIFCDSSNPYNLRSGSEFMTSNIHTVAYGSETISFRGPKIWAIVPKDIKNSNTLNEFKYKIKKWKPVGCTCRLCQVFIANLGFI